ncbi:hypothetical protein [Robiginitalea sediminis]|uniref:hypothetical protein n=1 Tax=Robiginitalea sediminis TaxID=1982593 RepID=UPI000B4B3536|nr:hypothetical protein [Robiginitalea sediminis]
MKTTITLLVLLFLSLGCSSDGDEDVTTKDGPFAISELAGTWDATKAQFSVSTTSVDLIEQGGSARMTVQTSGRFSLILNPADRPAYTVSGEMFWEAWQGSYYFAIEWDDDPGDWDTYGHTYNGTVLSLNGGADTGEYDFDNDGDFESCSIHFIFERG